MERCRKFSWVLRLLCLSDLAKIEFPWLILVKIHKYKIPRKASQWEPCFSIRTDRQTDGRSDGTDVTMLAVAWRKSQKGCVLILMWNTTLHTRGFVKSSSTSLSRHHRCTVLKALRMNISAFCQKSLPQKCISVHKPTQNFSLEGGGAYSATAYKLCQILKTTSWKSCQNLRPDV